METNWNQLIELYLQNELSEEGKNAFEQELSINPELREELEMHQLVRSAAKRAAQRNIIRQTGQTYLRNLRIKQFTIGVVVTTVAVVGIVYWTKNKTDKYQSERAALISEENSEELVCRAYQINQQSSQPGSKSSLIQPGDWQSTEEHRSRIIATNSGFIVQSYDPERDAQIRRRGMVDIGQTLKNTPPFTVDSTAEIKPTVAVLGYNNEKQEGKVVESQTLTSSLSKNMLWMQKYDSIGKFNDLYCGYALVMDKSKFGFVDPEGKIFIPIVYDQLVVTVNIKSSKQKNKRQKKKVLYIPKRSGKDVKDCDEQVGKAIYEAVPRSEEVERKLK